MADDDLLFGPGVPALRVEHVRITPVGVNIELATVAPSATCPCCGLPSDRVHGRYIRTLADAPMHGRRVCLMVGLRRFRCANPDCARRTFHEPLPGVAGRYARRTERLADELRAIAFAAGGEAGARLADALGMPASGDTLLRLIRSTPPASPHVAPRVLGVDDWALRRGQRYGTILCDLERRRPVDLLPERSPGAFAAWLGGHPGATVIARDRGGDYANGAALAAPAATQVADRWHLLRNLTDALRDALDRRSQVIRCAAAAARRAVPTTPIVPIAEMPSEATLPTGAEQRKDQRRQERLARYEQFERLRSRGASLRSIVRTMPISRGTARRFARAEGFPEQASRPKVARPIDAFDDRLRRRWGAGCHDAALLHRELRDQGFDGSVYQVRRHVSRWRDPADAGHVSGPRTAPRAPAALRPSARSATWYLLLEVERDHLSDEEQAFAPALYDAWPELRESVTLVQEFRRLLRDHEDESLGAWVELAEQTPAVVPEVKRFASGLRQDWTAVVEAVRGPWSSGQVEGQVNRLKLIKRQMYGRANFDLLRQRVLHAP